MKQPSVIQKFFPFPLLVLLLGATAAPAAIVSMSSVNGSYDQGAPFVAAASIDGNLGTGWGVFNGQTVAQTGIFIPSGGAVTASQIQFMLQNRFGDNHYVQEFRISTTTDAVPSLGGNWAPVSPSVLRSNNGTSVSAVGGGFARVTGAAAGGVTDAGWSAGGNFAGVTGFLLEMNPFDYDGLGPNQATLGRAPNGNFVLSEFVVTTDADINWALYTPTGFFNAAGTPVGDFSPAQAAANIVDGNTGSIGHPVGPGNDGYYAQIDLGLEIAIDRIEITGRLDCCFDRLQDYTLAFFAADGVTPVYSMVHPGATSATESLAIPGSPMAQFVRVTNTSLAAYGPQVGEIRVFGTIPEPSSLCLLGLGGIAFLRRRR